MFKKTVAALAVALLAPLALAQAGEAEIQKGLESRLGIKVESVTKSGYLGLYEVYADGHIFYTDEQMTAVLIGGDLVRSQNAINLIDLKTNRNVTDARLRKLQAINFADLPLDRAIKQVRGDGKRVLASFEDPNCGYCKRLAKDLQKLKNVTVYTFLYPILSEDSVKKSKQIWCAPDRAKAWSDWMIDGVAPSGRDDCDTAAVTKNQEYGRKLNITGTPTLIFANGERVPGAIPLTQIEQRLSGK